MSTPFEIKLKSIKVIENGTYEQEKGLNAVIAALHYPSPGKVGVITTRKCQLEDNVQYDYTTEDPILQYLFKEEILDSAILEIEITSTRKSSNLLKFLHSLLKTISNVALDSVLPGGSIVTAAVKTTSESVFELISPKDKIAIIGRAIWELKEDMDDGDLPLNLKVPKGLKMNKVETLKDGSVVIKQLTLRKGSNNAQVVVSIKKLY